MKKILAPLLLIIISSCNFSFNEKVKGNGHVATEARTVTVANKIQLSGIYDVVLTPGTTTSVNIEADDNLLPYIITKNNNGWLDIKTKKGFNLSTKNNITVYITTPTLEAINLSGTGNISGKGKFAGASQLDIKISGIGSANLDVNTPEVKVSISGSGSITLAGETENAKIDISGIGDYKGEALKAENVKVHVSGSGTAKVFAEVKLDAHVSGVGTVYYKGKAQVKQSVTGSGSINAME